jgi:tetratricopeptide (TPR) repeat protein
MPDRYEQLESLINGLANVQTQHRVSGLVSSAMRTPQSAEEQLKQVDRVLEAFQSLGQVNQDDPQNLDLLMTLGRTYDQFAYAEKALEIYRTALALADRLGGTLARAELLWRIGKSTLRLRKWREGLLFLDQSLLLYKAESDEAGQAMVQMHRGIALHEQGDYDQAEKVYGEALHLGEASGKVATVAEVEANLAVLKSMRGDGDGAILLYQRCLARFETLDDSNGLARTYHNMGMTHAKKENWREATQCYEKAFEIAHEVGSLDVVANIYLSRAELMMALGDTSMSATCCALALDIYRQTGDKLGEADSYRLLGNVFTLRKQWATAETLFADSIRLNIEFDNPLNVAETHRDLGKLYTARGQKMKAQESFTAALAGFENLGARADVEIVNALIAEVG